MHVVGARDLRSAGDLCQAKYPAVLERFQAKWKPVRVKKTRQNENLEPRFDSIETEKALDRLAGARGVGLQRPDALGQRAAALGNGAARGRAIGGAVGRLC